MLKYVPAMQGFIYRGGAVPQRKTILLSDSFLCGNSKVQLLILLVLGLRGLLQMDEKNLLQSYNDHIYFAIAAATFSPSIAALIIPPA